MQFWTFLHILSMFGAVMVIIGAELFATYGMRRPDLVSLRAFYRIKKGTEAGGGLLFLAGIIFGLIAAMTIGWDLTQVWLLLAYVLVGLTIVMGAANSSFLNRVGLALEANDGDEPGAELAALLASPRTFVVAALDVVILGVIIWDMVFKPSF